MHKRTAGADLIAVCSLGHRTDDNRTRVARSERTSHVRRAPAPTLAGLAAPGRQPRRPAPLSRAARPVRWRRERPCDLQPALLPKDEAQLARRTEAVGMRGPKGGAGTGVGDGAQKVLMEVATLAARSCSPNPPVCHSLSFSPCVSENSTADRSIKAEVRPAVQRRIPENARTSHSMQIPANSGNFCRAAKPVPHFP